MKEKHIEEDKSEEMDKYLEEAETV